MSLRKNQIMKERSLDSGRVYGTVLSPLSLLLSLYLQRKCVSTRFITADSGIISALFSALGSSYQAASLVKGGEEDESARVSRILSKNYMSKTYSYKNEVPCLCKINEIISAPDGI